MAMKIHISNFLMLLPVGFRWHRYFEGHAVALLVEAQVGRSHVRFRMASFEFFKDIILPASLWHWGRLSL